MSNSFKKIASGLLISLMSVFFTLLIIELFVRAFYPQELVYLQYSKIWKPVDIFGFKHQSNASVLVNIEDRKVHFKTDDNGFRIGDKEITQPDYKILALGDSMIEALHVEHEETVTGRLESIFSEDSGLKVKIVNTGVAGWGPDHYLLQAKSELSRDNYDLVVVFLYVGNDFETTERQYKFSPLTEKQIEQRRDLRLPRNLSKGEIMDSILYPINNFLETKSVSYVFFRQKARVLLMRIGFSPDYFPKVFLRSNATSSVFRVEAETCADIRDAALKKGLKTVFVLMPTSQQVQEVTFKEFITGFNIDTSRIDMDQPNRLINEEFSKLDLFLVDSFPALKAEHNRTGDRLYGEISNHFNSKGHEALANFLKPILEEMLLSFTGTDLYKK